MAAEASLGVAEQHRPILNICFDRVETGSNS